MKKIDTNLLFKRLKHIFHDVGSDADKDWKIVLVTFVVLLIMSFVWLSNIFIEAQNISTNRNITDSSAPELIDTESLKDLLSKYDRKSSEFEDISTDNAVFIDPAR